MSQKKDLNDDFFDKEDFNEKYYKAQKELIRRREIENHKAKRRFQRRQKIIRARKNIKNFLKNTGLHTFRYLKKCFDPTVVMPIVGSLVGSFIIYREIAKLSNDINQIIPTNQPEVHVDHSVSGQVKKIWKNNWPKIVTGTGVLIVGVGRQLYYNWQMESIKNKAISAENQLEQSKRDFQEFKTQSDLEKDSIRKDHAEKVDSIKKDHAEKVDSINKDHALKIGKLYVTLNRFNDAALESAQRETVMRSRIQECKVKIGGLIEERDALQEQVFEFQKINDEKDQKIQDLDLERKVLTKQLSIAAEEQAELTVEVEQLKKDKSAGILRRRKIKRQLNKAKAERSRLQDQLQQKTIELNNTRKEKQQVSNDLRQEEKRLSHARRIIDDLKEEANNNNRELEKANHITDGYARRMDQVQQELDSYKKSLSTVTQQKGVLARTIQEQERLLQKCNQDNDALRGELDRVQLGLGTITFESDKLISEIEQTKTELINASDAKKKQLTQVIKDRERQLQTNQKNTQKLKQRLRKIGHQLIDSEVKQKDLSEKVVQLQDQLLKEQARTSELESTVEENKKSYFSTLQAERAEQDQKLQSTVTTSQQLINDILDRQDESRSWWQRIPLFIRFSPQVNVKTGQKDVVKERQHHFYPSFVHEHVFPESVTERETPGRKEIFIHPKTSKK